MDARISPAGPRPVLATVHVCVASLGATLICHFLGIHPVVGVLLLFANLFAATSIVLRGSISANPFYWYLLVWDVTLAMYYSDILVYGSHLLDGTSEGFLFLAVLAGIIGYYLGNPPRRRGVKWDAVDAGAEYARYRRFIAVAAILGVIGVACFLTEMIGTYGALSLKDQELRDVFSHREVTILGQIGNLLLPGTMIAAAGLILFWEHISGRGRLLLALAAATEPVHSHFTGGRGTLLQIVIVVMASVALRRRVYRGYRRRGKTRQGAAALALLAVTIVGYFLYVGVARQESHGERTRLYSYLFAIFSCHVNPSLSGSFELLPDTAKDAVIESLTYLSSSIPYCQYGISHNEEPETYGLYLFPIITRRFAAFADFEDPGERYWRMGLEGRNAGVFHYGWFTMAYYLTQEFGRLGALLGFLAYGLLCASAVRLWRRAPTFPNALWMLNLCVISVYFPFYPITWDGYVVVLGITAGVMILSRQRVSHRWLPRTRRTPRRDLVPLPDVTTDAL